MSSIEERYSIWGVDKLVYGPIDRETLIRWTRDGRVTSETWVHDKQIDFWLQGEKSTLSSRSWLRLRVKRSGWVQALMPMRRR